MPIYKGANQITKVYQGENEIDKVYRGASKVYGADKGTEITVSGNPLVLTNVAKEKPLDTLEIMGRTEQVQLSGKNLVNAEAFYDVNNWTRISYGTWTYNIGKLEVGKKYTISLQRQGTNSLYMYFRAVYNGNNVTVSPNPYQGTTNNTPVTFTAVDNDYYQFWFYCSAETKQDVKQQLDTFTNVQVEQGTSATPYEQYCGGIPSPSPDYPQEIINVNSLEVVQSGKNLLDTNMKVTSQNVTYSFDDDGFITVTKTDTRNAGYVRGEIVLPKGTYTFSADALGEQMLISQCYAQLGSSWYLGNSIVRNPPVGMTRTFTVAEETKYNMFFAYCPASWVGTFKYGLQLEQGASATDYEPYKPIHIATIDNIELTKWDKVVKRNGVWGVSKWSKNADIVMAGVNSNNGYSVILNDIYVDSLASWHTDILCTEAVPRNPPTTSLDGLFIGVLKTQGRIYWGGANYSTDLRGKTFNVTYRTNTEQSFTPLSQSVQEQLNALQIVKPTTVVTNDNECEMSATYLCYLDNTEAMLSAMYQNDLSEVLK